MIKRIYLYAVLLLGISQTITAQTTEWAARLGGSHWDEATDMAISPLDNSLFVSGMMADTVVWQPGSALETNGSGDFWIARYDNNGTPLWMQSGGSKVDDRFNAIALSPMSDAIYAAGTIRDTVILGNDSLKTEGLYADDPIVVKYNAENGELIWKEHWKGKGLATAQSIATDIEGNVYVGISFRDSIYVESDSLAALGSNDVLLIKLNAEGVFQWYRQFGGAGADMLQDMVAAPDGSLYLSGYFQQLAQWGIFTLTSAGESDIFMARLNPDGDVIWAKSEGGIYSESIASIAVANNDQIYWVGQFNQSTEIGTYPLTSNGITNTLIMASDTSGNIIWVAQGNGTINSATGVATDWQGNAYISGSFSDNITFANHSLTAVGSREMFVARYSRVGEAQWIKGVAADEESNFSSTAAIQTDPDGNCYTIGNFNGIFLSDDYEFVSSGFSDVFLMQINQPLVINIETIPSLPPSFTAYYQNNQIDIQLNTNDVEPTKILLTDLYGRTIWQQQLDKNDQQHHIDLATTTLPSGLYVVSLQDTNKIVQSIKIFIP